MVNIGITEYNIDTISFVTNTPIFKNKNWDLTVFIHDCDL